MHMKDTVFALLPLNGQGRRTERRGEKKTDATHSGKDLSLNSEQQVLPVLLNMN